MFQWIYCKIIELHWYLLAPQRQSVSGKDQIQVNISSQRCEASHGGVKVSSGAVMTYCVESDAEVSFAGAPNGIILLGFEILQKNKICGKHIVILSHFVQQYNLPK